MVKCVFGRCFEHKKEDLDVFQSVIFYGRQHIIFLWYVNKWVGFFYSYCIGELRDHSSQFICSTNHRVSTSRFFVVFLRRIWGIHIMVCIYSGRNISFICCWFVLFVLNRLSFPFCFCLITIIFNNEAIICLFKILMLFSLCY